MGDRQEIAAAAGRLRRRLEQLQDHQRSVWAGEGFGLFVAVYTPMIGMIASVAGKAATLVGSGLYVIKRVIEDPSVVGQYLASTTNYRLAGRILLETVEKQVSGIHLSHIVIAGITAVVLIVLVVRATRIVWSKGETHVSII